MILNIFYFIKFLIFLTILFMVIKLFKKKEATKTLILLGIIIALFAVFSNKITTFIPSLTEQVEIIATGEKQEASSAPEVYFKEYIIDNRQFSCGQSMIIDKGHWFWTGDTYCWRPETDSRKPDGITREIIVRIPVGWNRILNFEGNIFRGKVKITTENSSWIIDTFSEETSIVSIDIGQSKDFLLILNQAKDLAVYSIILIVLSIILTAAIQNSTSESRNTWLRKNAGKIICGIISLTTFVYMIYYSTRISLWSDELAQISFVCKSIKNAIYNCLTMGEVSPPLPSICYTLWYQNTSYGDRWILLPSIVLTVLSIYIIGLIGEKFRGKYCGILCSVLMASSSVTWLNVAYEFRAYCFLVLFSTLTLYCYLKRNIDNENIKWCVCFSLSLTGLAMSHYFGMIACGCFFLEDIYFFIKKKLSFKKILTIYIFPGIISIFWLAAVWVTILTIGGPKGSITWQPVPTVAHVQSLLQFISGDYPFTYWILLLGILFPLGYFLEKKANKYNKENLYRKFSILMIIGSILLLFIYGNFINRKNTMWQNRYFLFLLPHACLVSALMLDDICEFIFSIRKEIYIRRSICFFISGILFLNCFSNASTFKSAQPYKEAADWLYGQSNYIYNDDTLVIATSKYAKGWDEYYLTRKGRRDSINMYYQSDLSEKDILNYKKIYLQYSHIDIAQQLQTTLNQYYNQEADRGDISVKIYSKKE